MKVFMIVQRVLMPAELGRVGVAAERVEWPGRTGAGWR